MHISDILDNTFQYEEGLSVDFPIENWIKDRYSLLWDIYIDGRLCREGKGLVKGRSERIQEFALLYRKIPGHQSEAMFEGLWNAKDLTHKEIVDSAQNTANLFKLTGINYVREASLDKKTNLAGMPCPLCHFPTYFWEEEELSNFEEPVIKIIQEDYPQWTVEAGACPRCRERYSIIAETMNNSPKDGSLSLVNRDYQAENIL
jgi:hypothetical protein